ncbi:MAG: magnesium transporter MgtE [Selenomonadaceae bacterium]
MAKKKETPAAVYLPEKLGQKEKPARSRWILKLFGIILLLLVLIIGGFFLGVYMRIFDTNAVNEKLGLYKFPIIGQYFVKPVPSDGIANTDTAKKKIEDVKPNDKVQKTVSKPIVLTKAEIEKQMKVKQAEEKKRISKLARLYNEMKPQEAADIMNDMDDDMTIAILQKMDESQSAKVLTKFDPSKSARLTKIIYNGNLTKVQVQDQQTTGQTP